MAISWRETKKSQKFYVTYRLPNCIGIIDGTLLFLTETPAWSGEDFNTQKGGYGINALVVCDDQCHVTYYYAGWPESTQGNRSWRNCKSNLMEADFFNDMEYIIGHSACNPSKRLTSTYKKPSGQVCLIAENELFNTKVASAHIKSEHCIGLIKNRFTCLCTLNIKLKSLGCQKLFTCLPHVSYYIICYYLNPTF
jgi:hypothetical protein